MFKVQISYVHPNIVSHSFHHSMMRITSMQSPDYIFADQIFAARGSSLGLVDARNELMRLFLDTSDATHIWMIDTDMGFAASTIADLLKADKLAIGALCYGQSEAEPDDFGGYRTKPFAVAYDLVRGEQGPAFYTLKSDLDIEAKTVQHVAATGTGCLLIARSAAELVRQNFGDCWFDQVAYENSKPVLRISEDLSFCYRLSAVGIPVFVHTGVRTNHMKSIWI